MHPNITIRTETPADYDAVEKMTRSAFYNLYVPGCNEHYLVRTMRPHPDFVPELDLVLELDGKIIGNIMYTKTRLVDDAGGRPQLRLRAEAGGDLSRPSADEWRARDVRGHDAGWRDPTRLEQPRDRCR